MTTKHLFTMCIITGGALAATFLWHQAAPQEKTDCIIVGTSPDFPPFSYIQDDTIMGFDIDIMQEIGKRLNKKIELKSMPFTALIPALQCGTLEVIAAGLTATEERSKHMFFTTPYLEDGPLVIVSLNNNPVQTVAELAGKKVVVNEGHTADLFISKIEGLSIQRLKTVADAFLALTSGRASALVVAENVVKPWVDHAEKEQFHIAPIPGTGENSCMAISLHYKELFQEIQRALDSMKVDGSLEKIQAKWNL